MPRTPRRHIRNPAKPPVFRPPAALDIHMISVTKINGFTAEITMSAPIKSPISSENFWVASISGNTFFQGNFDVISGGPLITFQVKFDDNAPGTILNDNTYIIN